MWEHTFAVATSEYDKFVFLRDTLDSLSFDYTYFHRRKNKKSFYIIYLYRKAEYDIIVDIFHMGFDRFCWNNIFVYI